LVLVFSLETVVQAQPKGSVKAYEEAVQRGAELFKAENYPAARAEFEKAYQIHSEPQLLFNIASTYRREGDKKTSVEWYKKFLDVAPVDNPRRQLAEETIQTLDDLIAAQQAQAASANSNGGGASGLADPRPAVDEPPRPGAGLMWTGVGVAIVGGVVLSLGAFEGQRARERNDLLEDLPMGTQWTPELQDQFEEGEAFETRAIVFSIVGTLALATGVTLAILGWQKGKNVERNVAVTPYATDDQVGVAFTGRF